MLERFFPDFESTSTYAIDFKGLYNRGKRGVIFDVDNTLVPHGAPATKEAKALFKSWVFRVCFYLIIRSRG